MEKTRVTIVRHGETEWNAAMRLQGKQNSNLSRTGKIQVERVAQELAKRTFDILITSDLGRAVDTAKAINTFHSLVIAPDTRLRERNFGVMEGLTREEIQEKHPGVFEEYHKRKDTYEIPGGESLVQFYNRVSQALESIVEKNRGKNILIVAHGGVLDCAIRKVFGYSLDAHRCFALPNAAINVFNARNNEWSLDEWGNVNHLMNIDTADDLDA
jgi:2,3-bisphosphoglycerate-dependent phosphoglycerate mutase